MSLSDDILLEESFDAENGGFDVLRIDLKKEFGIEIGTNMDQVAYEGFKMCLKRLRDF